MKTSNQGYTDHHETILLRGLSLKFKLKMSPLSLLGSTTGPPGDHSAGDNYFLIKNKRRFMLIALRLE